MMNKPYCIWIIAALLVLFSLPSIAMNPLKYTKNLQTQNADPSSRSTLLGIIESCGNVTNINDDCVLKGLERVSIEENNEYATAIGTNYEKALAEGQYNTIPECQTETHMQVNRILGHCILLMNYYALKDYDKTSAIHQYELCLQGGMQGLVYQGNIVAQSILINIYDKKGLFAAAEIWTKAIKKRKHTEDYALLMQCYK